MPYDTYRPDKYTKPVLPKKDKRPLRVGQWIGIFILSALPLINIICYFVWAFSKNTFNESKKNYARAILLLILIAIIIMVAAVVVLSLLNNITNPLDYIKELLEGLQSK